MAKLVKTLQEIQKYANVNDGLDLEAVDPSMTILEEDDLAYFIGDDLVGELEASYGTDLDSMNPRIKAIFPLVQRFVVCVGLYNAITEIEVQISGDGITRKESNDTKSAFGGQVVRLKETFGNRGYSALDKVLNLLEKYEQDYPEWQTSDYYADKSGLIIKSVSDFHQIGKSPLSFMKLWPLIRDVQRIQISEAMPKEFFQLITDEIDSDSLSEDNKILVNDYLKPAIASFTTEQALIELPVQVDSSGNISMPYLDSGDGRKRSVANEAMITRKLMNVRGKGHYYLEKMKEFLNSNSSAGRFALWFGSENYSKPLSEIISENSMDSSERKIYRA